MELEILGWLASFSFMHGGKKIWFSMKLFMSNKTPFFWIYYSYLEVESL